MLPFLIVSCGEPEKQPLTNQQKAAQRIKQFLDCKKGSKTIKFGNLEVMEMDFYSDQCELLFYEEENFDINNIIWDSLSEYNNLASFASYQKILNVLGDGWRVPTAYELKTLYENRKEIGGFNKDVYYLSSTLVDSDRSIRSSQDNVGVASTDIYGISFWNGEVISLSSGITMSGAEKSYQLRAVKNNPNTKTLCECISDGHFELIEDFSPECDWISKMPNSYLDTALINAWDKCPTLFDNSMTTFENGPYAFLENHTFIDKNALIGTESRNTRQNFELLFENGTVTLDKGNYNKEQQLTYTVEEKFWNDTNRIYKEVYDITICGSNHYAYGKCFNVLLYRKDNGDYECHVRGDYFYKAFLKIKPKYVEIKNTKNENKELSQEEIENAREKAADLEDENMN